MYFKKKKIFFLVLFFVISIYSISLLFYIFYNLYFLLTSLKNNLGATTGFLHLIAFGFSLKKKKNFGRFFGVVVTFYGFSYLVGCYIVFSYLGFACFSGYWFGCLLSLVLSSFYLFIYFFKSLFLSLFVWLSI